MRTGADGVPLISIGRSFFALALLGLGAEHFVYEEFVTGRAPAWPDGLPGKLVWVYASGVLVSSAWPRSATGLMIFSWFWIVHLPRVGMSVSDGIAVFEALGVSGIALVVAGVRTRKSH